MSALPEAEAVGRELRREPPLDRLCRRLALLGGVLLALAGLVTVVSVSGRYLFVSPIRGDAELVSNLTAMAVALFLPYCQLRRGHVIVDVFTERARPRVRALLDALGSLALLVIAAVMAWRLAIGGLDLRSANDETMVLRLPTWWAFVVIVPAIALLALAALTTLCRDLAAARENRAETPR